MKKITTETIKSFNDYLINEEKAAATVNKYLHDVGEFQMWLGEQELCKTVVLAYKSYLCEHYAPASVNAALSSLNSFCAVWKEYGAASKAPEHQSSLSCKCDEESV